jgi:hypothetical protein
MKRNIVRTGWTPLVVLAILSTFLLFSQGLTPVQAHGPNPLTGKWDRLNPDQSNPTPEHEILRCSGSLWLSCIYDKQSEPFLGFENPPDSTYGLFRGEEVIGGWSCPTWFPANLCNNTSFVASGVMKYMQSDGSILVVDQELVVTYANGSQVLYMHWVDQHFACPWYRSFKEALEANPFPLPFNGEDWPGMDCIFSP